MGILIFVLGLVIGSFLNVCICRIPQQENIVHGSSYCPHCKNPLKAWDLIPLFSYLFLQGRCRYCGVKINIQYPLVELLTGILFLIFYLNLGWQLILIKYLVLLSLLIITTMIDLELQLIPDILVLIILGWAFLWQVFLPELTWLQSIFGSILGGGILLLIAILSKGGMGGGDIKLMFAAGFFLGISSTFLALFISFISGGIIGAILLISGKKERQSPIPFGPFLVLGIIVAALWGEEIIKFYLNFST